MAGVEGRMSPKLSPEMQATAVSRRERMRLEQTDPMMTVGAGSLPQGPGSPGSRLDDTMGDTVYQHDTRLVSDALDLEKLQGLFEGHRAMAPEMRERQLKCMTQITRHYAEGLLIRDLPCLTSVLTVARNNVNKGLTEFAAPLVEVLRLLGLPMIKLASSDDLRSIRNLCDVVCAMGQCTECTDDAIVAEAAQSLVQFATMNRIRTLGEEAGETFLQSNFSQRIIERAQLVPILVAILRDSIENRATSAAVTKCLKAFSSFASNARQVIASGASELLVTVLTEDFTEPSVPTAIEVLWNCLENEESTKEVLSTWHTINTLKELLERLIVHGCRECDKETRNECAILLGLIAKDTTSHPHFLETGLLQLLLHLGTAHELGWGDTFVAPFFQLTTDLDFEFKQLMFGVLGSLVETDEALQLMLESDIMVAMCQHLDQSYQTVSVWLPAQEKELLFQCLRILFTAAPRALSDFDRAGGFVTTHELLKIGNHPNATQEEMAPVAQALNLVTSLASEVEYRESMGSCGFLSTLLDVVTGNDTSSLGTVLRQDALTAISLLCEGCSANQRVLRKVGGIAKISQFLSYNAKDPNRQEKVVLSAVDCVWNAVVGNKRNEAGFLAEGGMERLLSLLEGSPLSVRVQVLGVVADLILNPKSLSFVYEWRSDTSAKHILQVIVDCWREEELRLGHTCPDDVITDVLRPLLGVEPKGGRPAGAKEKKGPPSRPTEVVISEALKPLSRTLPPPAPDEAELRENPIPPTAKLVKGALIQSEDPTMIAGRNDLLFARISTSDSKAKMFCILQSLDMERFEELSPLDQVKLPLINRYLDFKESEVWHDMERELEAENVRPVTPDESWLAARLEQSEYAALEVQNTQRMLVKDIEDEDKVGQIQFLEGIAENMHKDIAQTIKKGRAMIMAKKGMAHKL